MDYRKAAEDFVRYKMPHGHTHPPFAKYQMFNKGEHLALFWLMCQKGNATPGEIATATGTSTARVTAMLNKLEEKGLVSRSMDPADRRRIIVSITDKGKDIITRHRKEVLDMVEVILRKMGEHDTKEFLRLFGDFFNYMTQMHEKKE